MPVSGLWRWRSAEWSAGWHQCFCLQSWLTGLCEVIFLVQTKGINAVKSNVAVWNLLHGKRCVLLLVMNVGGTFCGEKFCITSLTFMSWWMYTFPPADGDISLIFSQPVYWIKALQANTSREGGIHERIIQTALLWQNQCNQCLSVFCFCVRKMNKYRRKFSV